MGHYNRHHSHSTCDDCGDRHTPGAFQECIAVLQEQRDCATEEIRELQDAHDLAILEAQSKAWTNCFHSFPIYMQRGRTNPYRAELDERRKRAGAGDSEGSNG